METNYVLLVGLFLLLVAVDCSSSDPKGNVNEKTGLDQNVDGTVNPVKGKVYSKSILDSIGVSKVKDNGGDQIDGSEGGIDSDTSKSNLNQQSGSNDGENLLNDGKESSAEAKGKTDGGKESDNVHNGEEESNVEDKEKTGSEKEGDNMHNGQEELNVEDKRKTDGEKEGDNMHNGQEELNVEDKRKTDGEKEGDIVEESNLETQGKTNGEKKENPDDSVDPTKVIKEKDNILDLVQLLPPPPPTRNDGFRGEECDSSNMCMDMNKRFAACLQVPGNESPDLLLLIQNKGKGPLTLKISAPAFVQLNETDVELEEKQDKKVKIFIKNSGTGNLIVLKDDGSGECSLDFKDLIMHNSAKSYVNFLSQTPTTAFIFAAAILILASRWMCKSFRRRQLARSGLKYRRLDMELPVSGGARREPDVNDGWNNSWGDNWDDEEAPVTPSMPVTPSLSSKGLASRRLGKEGWKD